MESHYDAFVNAIGYISDSTDRPVATAADTPYSPPTPGTNTTPMISRTNKSSKNQSRRNVVLDEDDSDIDDDDDIQEEEEEEDVEEDWDPKDSVTPPRDDAALEKEQNEEDDGSSTDGLVVEPMYGLNADPHSVRGKERVHPKSPVSSEPSPSNLHGAKDRANIYQPIEENDHQEEEEEDEDDLAVVINSDEDDLADIFDSADEDSLDLEASLMLNGHAKRNSSSSSSSSSVEDPSQSQPEVPEDTMEDSTLEEFAVTSVRMYVALSIRNHPEFTKTFGKKVSDELKTFAMFLLKARISGTKGGCTFDPVPFLHNKLAGHEGIQSLCDMERMHKAHLQDLMENGNLTTKKILGLLKQGYAAPRFDFDLLNTTKSSARTSKKDREARAPLKRNARCFQTDKLIGRRYHRVSLFRDSEVNGDSGPKEVRTQSFEFFVRDKDGGDDSDTSNDDAPEEFQGDIVCTAIWLLIVFYAYPLMALKCRQEHIERLKEKNPAANDKVICQLFVADRKWWTTECTRYLYVRRFLEQGMKAEDDSMDE